MSRRTVVPLFISSPSDCGLERDAVKRAVEAYNTVARTSHNLEVLAFDQRELYAGAAPPGKHAQQVANQQLQTYEIYVGLWRERLGTPTPVASSGTMEELGQALQRLRVTRRPWVMAYFWAGSTANFDEIKSTLREHSSFYHTFNDPAHLGATFSTHLNGYLRDQYRLQGHSTTQLRGGSRESTLGAVHMTFDVHTDLGTQRYSFDRASVAVGRQPDRNDIVIQGQGVHREQGLFLFKDGIVFYVDLAGDSHVEVGSQAGLDRAAYGQQIIREGDAVVLPDQTRIRLRAVVS